MVAFLRISTETAKEYITKVELTVRKVAHVDTLNFLLIMPY